MGYTHYWYRKPGPADPDKWDAFLADAILIVQEYMDDLGHPSGEEGSPLITTDRIAFNGIGEESHETFAIDRVCQGEAKARGTFGGLVFDCCKTARKVYDLPVMLILLRLAWHFAGDVRVASDGDWSDEWLAARREHVRLFGASAAPCLNRD